MYIKYEFKDDVKNDIILLDGKRYSDTGMMWRQLSDITGIDMDTLSMYDDWYILDDGFYYFKSNYIFEELFMSELAHECGVKCVEFKLAENSTSFKYPVIGVISKLYRNKDREYYYYSDFCKKYFDDYIYGLDKLKYLCSLKFGEDKTNKLMNDMYGMISFDMFTGQYDRGQHNFLFEYDDNGISLAPLCDNGLVFNYGFNYEAPFGNFCLLEGDLYSSFKQDLIGFIRNEKILYERFECLLGIDVKSVLERTIDKYMIVIGVSDRNKILRYMDCRKRAIDCTLYLSKR